VPFSSLISGSRWVGNEADYVIVSLVRSSRPGFLSSVRRMNVMLTRCRRGLIIVSSQAFLRPGGKGSDTLLGKLVQHWQSEHAQTWISWNSVLNALVALPGVTRSETSGRRPPVKAAPQQKHSSKGNPATSTVRPAQGQKSRKPACTRH
jgi:hypothetical protein